MNVLVIGKTTCGISHVAGAIGAALPGSVLHQDVRDIGPFCSPADGEHPNVVGLRLENWVTASHLRAAAANNEFPLKFDRVLLIVRDFRDEMVERLLSRVGHQPHIDRCDARGRAWLAAIQAKESGQEPKSFSALVTLLNQLFGLRYTPIAGADHAAMHLLRSKFAPVRVVRYEDLLVQGSQALAEALGDELAARIQLDGFPGLDYEPIAPGSWKSFITHADVPQLAEAWRPFLQAMACDDWSGLAESAVAGNPWSALVTSCLDHNGPTASPADSRSATDVPPGSRRILYVHVAKTAGTTVNDYIAHNLPGLACCLHVENEPAWNAPDRWPELRNYAFLSGHVPLPAFAARLPTQDYLRIATFREPAQQLASHLAWVRHLSDPGKEGLLAQHPSDVQSISRQLSTLNLADPGQIGEFIRNLDDYAVGLFDNTQCRYLVQMPHRMRMTAAYLEEAICRLGMLDIAGITEQLDETLAQVASAMGWPAPAAIARLNAGNARYGMDASAEAFIEAVRPAIWADLVLYDEARKRFWSRST